MRFFFYIVFAIPVAAYVIIGRAPISAPMTKTKSIVLVCAICLFIGLVFLVGITEERKDIKAKMTEVLNSMSNVASAVEAYHQDEKTWPHCNNIVAIRTTLGIGAWCPDIPTNRISSITVTSPRAEEVIITTTIKGIDSRVDGKNLTLTGKAWERGILWVWDGTVPSSYVPKK
jgi:hypothetical protein